MNFRDLHKKAGIRKYLTKLCVAATKEGMENPNDWDWQLDARGSVIIYHRPTMEEAARIEQEAVDKKKKLGDQSEKG